MQPVVRQPSLDFSDLRRDWLGGLLLISLRADALHLLFPSGERFFVRSVMAMRDRIDDPALQARVRSFAGQEAMHGQMHARCVEALEAQGFEVRSAIARYDRWAWERLEPWGTPRLRLAVTAALEHLTAVFAIRALQDGRIDAMDPPMRDLMRWHAAEEIEHRDVAFDVWRQVDGRYLVRAVAMVVALVGLAVFWGALYRHLRRQAPDLTRSRARRERRELRRRGWTLGFVARRALVWFRPGFHPRDEPADHLVERALAGLAWRAA